MIYSKITVIFNHKNYQIISLKQYGTNFNYVATLYINNLRKAKGAVIPFTPHQNVHYGRNNYYKLHITAIGIQEEG